MLKGLVAISKSSVAWKAQLLEGVIGGRKSRLWLYECVHVPLRVFSCDPLGGAMQRGGGKWVKRRTMSAAGARMLRGRGDGGEGQRRGEGVALL